MEMEGMLPRIEGRLPRVDSRDQYDNNSKNILELLSVLEREQIELPPGIIERLKLLDTPRCSNGNCLSSDNKTYEAEDAEGNIVVKKNETHLEHSLKLAEILKILLPHFLREKPGSSDYQVLERKVITAALLHDIGKTGPEMVDGQKIPTEMNDDFVLLFSIFEKNKKEGSSLPECSIAQAIENHIPLDRKEGVTKTMKSLGLLDKKMKDLFGSHLQYSLDVLQAYQERSEMPVDPVLIFLVGNHHRWMHNYSYNPNGHLLENLPDNPEIHALADRLATLVELADMYQAISSRGEQKRPSETLKKIKEDFQKFMTQPGNSSQIPEEVQRIIKKLMTNKSIIRRLDALYEEQNQI